MAQLGHRDALEVDPDVADRYPGRIQRGDHLRQAIEPSGCPSAPARLDPGAHRFELVAIQGVAEPRPPGHASADI
jgi:hypothetical protein